MDFIDKQVAPPRSWEKFEDLTRALFAAIWRAPLTQKNGRAGQKQHGVDVFGTPADAPGRTYGAQCKGKNRGYDAKATIAEFDAELAKAEEFRPTLGHWTFATTAPNDVGLQEHARLVSEQRTSKGRFPVVAIGWETIQALLSVQSAVVEEFYPEHAGDLGRIMAMLRALPTAEQMEQIRRSLLASVPGTAATRDDAAWLEVRFQTARDLGPALMGRPLGPADVAACPVLPEAAALIADLERAGSARLAGVAGAGKSICTLQVARQLHDLGWRVLRLTDPMATIAGFADGPAPTLYIIDDAHLTRPALLRDLEENATANQWILSAHTTSDGKAILPGTIQLDAKRAVRVIADGLRARRDTTLAAVRRVDDRVGDRPEDERLEHRLDQAEQAEFPWQFCFILGGGWRRATALASSARAAGADLVLAAAAIRQLATRDARCEPGTVATLLDNALAPAEFKTAADWLVSQRLLLGQGDLRCPHQRLAGVLLDRILEGQNAEGRQGIARMLRKVLQDPDMPLAGLALLIAELSDAGGFGRWRGLVARAWLDPVLERCWSATAPLDIRHAGWVLSEMYGFLPDEMAEIERHQHILAAWIEAAAEGACYAVGRLISHVQNRNRTLGQSIVAQVDPRALGHAISVAGPLHACEIANLMSMMRAGEDEAWKATYLAHVDREACIRKVSTWPQNAYLSAVADLCEHFCYFEPGFGFTLIEALIPAIANRLRADPQDAFHELNDIVWHALRLYDPLRIYVGKLAPTRRMLQVGRRICACWTPADLAAKLSRSSQGRFQSAAGLLSFMRKASPKQFTATVSALDWNLVDEAIGADWAEGIGDARMLLGVAYTLPAARPAIEALVARNEPRIVMLSTHLAVLAPATARRHVAAGKKIALTYSGHVDWKLGVVVLARFFQSERALIPALLEPHLVGLAETLSQPSPTFYNEALLFLRLFAQVAPEGMQRVLGQIDIGRAGRGWRDALRGCENNRVPGAKSQARQVAAFLVFHALGRKDDLGGLARQLRREFPRHSVPLPKTIEPIDLSEPAD